MSEITVGHLTVEHLMEHGWSVINGDLQASFGNGMLARRKAITMALRLVSPDLAACVEKVIEQCPKATERALAAALMFIEDQATNWSFDPDHPNTVATVCSQSSSQVYKVYRGGAPLRLFGCDCKDFSSWQAPTIDAHQRICKHILTVAFYLHLGIPPGYVKEELTNV